MRRAITKALAPILCVNAVMVTHRFLKFKANAARTFGELEMEVHELVIEMKLLERRMTLYEEKYGVLSEDFYAALMAGELAEYDAHDETRADFSRWKGIYETWLRRKEAYQKKLQERELAKLLRFQPAY